MPRTLGSKRLLAKLTLLLLLLVTSVFPRGQASTWLAMARGLAAETTESQEGLEGEIEVVELQETLYASARVGAPTARRAPRRAAPPVVERARLAFATPARAAARAYAARVLPVHRRLIRLRN